MQNSGLLLSGGIHNTYNTDLVRLVTDSRQQIPFSHTVGASMARAASYNHENKLESVIPSEAELLFIMQRALAQMNMVGVSTQLV
jgi:hypothetical protein